MLKRPSEFLERSFNTTGATSGVVTAYPSGTPEFTLDS